MGRIEEIELAIVCLEEQIANIYEQCGVKRKNAANQKAAISLMNIINRIKRYGG